MLTHSPEKTHIYGYHNKRTGANPCWSDLTGKKGIPIELQMALDSKNWTLETIQ